MKRLAIVLAVLLISPLSFAEREGKKGGGWLKKMELSESDIKKIKEIRESSKEELQQKRDIVKQERELLKTMIKGTSSNSAVKAQHAKVKKLKTEIMDKRFDNFLKIREIVPAEKRQYLKLPKNKNKRNKKD